MPPGMYGFPYPGAGGYYHPKLHPQPDLPDWEDDPPRQVPKQADRSSGFLSRILSRLFRRGCSTATTESAPGSTAQKLPEP